MKIVVYKAGRVRYDIAFENHEFKMIYIAVRIEDEYLNGLEHSGWVDLAWFNRELFNFGEEL